MAWKSENQQKAGLAMLILCVLQMQTQQQRYKIIASQILRFRFVSTRRATCIYFVPLIKPPPVYIQMICSDVLMMLMMMAMTDDRSYVGDSSGACVRGPMRRGGARSGVRAVAGPSLQVRSAPGTRCQDHPLPCIRPR